MKPKRERMDAQRYRPKVYRYGARPPTEGVARVDAQMREYHRYRNALVEIERRRLAAVRAVIASDDRVAAEAVRIKTLPKGLEQRAARAAFKELRRVAAAEQKTRITPINARAAEERRGARAATGAYWGTYLLAEQAVDAAKKSRRDPKFKCWDGSGRVGVQIQHGLAVSAAWGAKDTRLRLFLAPDPPGMSPGSRRSGKRAVIWLRVGSDKRAPVWTQVPFILHRPMPESGVIKLAVLRRHRVGPDFRWTVQFTVESPTAEDPKVDLARRGAAAVDLGWRSVADGLRVGYWRDDAGRHGEFVLPASHREAVVRIRSLIGARDRLFNDARDRLVGWLKDRRREDLPEWFREETASVAAWRSPRRLAALAARWGRERFVGDEDVYPTGPSCPRDRNGVVDCVAHVECWTEKNRHLYRWISHWTAKVLGRRNESYRLFGVDFARRYATVVVEKFRLPKVAGRAKLPEGASDAEKTLCDRASSLRHLAAPGAFRLALKAACASRGTRFVEAPAAFTTLDCAACGHRNSFDAATSVEQQCVGCGRVWDQDDNATQNLLAWLNASGPVDAGVPDPLAPVMSERQKRFRARRGKKEEKRSSEAPGCSNLASETAGLVGVLVGAVEVQAHLGRR